MRGPSKFKQSEVERVVRAVQHSGLRIAGVRIDKDGTTIEIATTGRPQDTEADTGDKVTEDIVL